MGRIPALRMRRIDSARSERSRAVVSILAKIGTELILSLLRDSVKYDDAPSVA